MGYLEFALGYRTAGTTVRVTLDGNAANLRLLDEYNFSRYRSGGAYRFFGGLARRSPVVMVVPTAGTWHLVVDMAGLGGQVRAKVETF